MKTTYLFILLLLVNTLVIKTFASFMIFVSGFSFIDSFMHPVSTFFSLAFSIILTTYMNSDE